MTPTKSLPSDEERALENAGPHDGEPYDDGACTSLCGGGLACDCSRRKRAQAIAALLAQVRAEASREKDAEIERLKAWVSDLQAGTWVNCVYCGHRYGPGETTPVSMADALKEHIRRCAKHPLAAAEAERDALQEENARLKGEKGDAEEVLGWAGGSVAGLVAAAHNATAERDALRERVRLLEEALVGTTEHLAGGIRESQADYASPLEPATRWDCDAATHVMANRALLFPKAAPEKEGA